MCCNSSVPKSIKSFRGGALQLRPPYCKTCAHHRFARTIACGDIASLLQREMCGKDIKPRLPALHHCGFEPRDRKIHHRRNDREDRDRRYNDVHLEDLAAVLDDVAEAQVG